MEMPTLNMRIKSLAIVVFATILAFALLFPSSAGAAHMEQDDCATGYVIDKDAHSCVAANSETDPDNCLSQGTADATERCLAESRSRQGSCEDSASFFLGLPTWYKYLEFDSNCEISGPHKPGTEDLDWQKAGGLVGLAVVEIMTRLAALVALAYVIYGGFRYITSQGEPENTKSARQTITNGLIGLVIALVATASVAFIANLLTS